MHTKHSESEDIMDICEVESLDDFFEFIDILSEAHMDEERNQDSLGNSYGYDETQWD